MENVKLTSFGEEEEENKKRAYNRPRYKGISESLMGMLDEKERVIQALEKENNALKQALKAFIN